MRYIKKHKYMQDNYAMTQSINFKITLAVAYSKALQVMKSKMLKDFILINN